MKKKTTNNGLKVGETRTPTVQGESKVLVRRRQTLPVTEIGETETEAAGRKDETQM